MYESCNFYEYISIKLKTNENEYMMRRHEYVNDLYVEVNILTKAQ